MIREAPMSRTTTVRPDVIAVITNFGDLLRYLRQRAQLTQRDLAVAVGYSVSQISRLEHNERLPDELTLLSVFVPALGLEQESTAVERLLALARQVRWRDTASPTQPQPSRETALTDHATSQPTSRHTNLPHRLTSFIGHEQEVAALQRLVQEQRLVTLTGVGGVGKSSLALAVGHAIAASGASATAARNPEWHTPARQKSIRFPDGIWLLELAAINEGSLVARTLADLFKVPESPAHTQLDAVLAYLHNKEVLLLFDNCEHLIATCADLIERLLQAEPRLHILVTSRETLNIAGEREWPVLPLSTPPHTTSTELIGALSQLQPFTAAQLFIERAQAVKADLRFTDQEAPLITQLCQQLDGLPLALELAAARCKSFTLREIVARLHNRFNLLSAGRRTALLRHQTLRAMLDWSYDLLTPAEATLFRSLAVFAGGWTLEAVEQVAVQPDSHLSTSDLLHQLVNKSLVVVDQQGEKTHYRMLETIRHYANEKLQEQGEGAAVSARHFAYYLALAEKVTPANLLGERFEQWFNAIKADLDNVRAAFAWSQTQSDGGTQSLQLAVALGPFWQLQKNVHEGSHWLEHALERAAQTNTVLTSWGMVWLALTICYVSPRSLTLATEARQRFAQLQQPDGVALANLLLGIWAVAQDDATKALDALQQASAHFAQNKSRYFLGWAYFHLADAFALMGQREQALHYYRLTCQLGVEGDREGAFRWVWDAIAALDPAEALALCQQQLEEQRQRQNGAKIAGILQRLGHILTIAGDLPGAVAALTESLALWQKLGIQWRRGGGTSRACLDLALVHYLRQEYQQAQNYAQQATQHFQEAGDLYHMAHAEVALGYPALARNDLTLARASFHQCLRNVAAQGTNCTYLALVGLAETARCQMQPMLAARLFGIAEQLAQRPKPIEDRWKEAYCRPLRTAANTHLRHAPYAAAWAEGQTMPLEQAMQLALNFV